MIGNGAISVRGVTGIFFLRWPSHFSWFFSRVLTSFHNFSYFLVQFSTFPFTIFLLFFSIFTPFPVFLASFSPIRQQKFPGQKSLGGTLPPAPPTCYATDFSVDWFYFSVFTNWGCNIPWLEIKAVKSWYPYAFWVFSTFHYISV